MAVAVLLRRGQRSAAPRLDRAVPVAARARQARRAFAPAALATEVVTAGRRRRRDPASRGRLLTKVEVEVVAACLRWCCRCRRYRGGALPQPRCACSLGGVGPSRCPRSIWSCVTRPPLTNALGGGRLPPPPPLCSRCRRQRHHRCGCRCQRPCTRSAAPAAASAPSPPKLSMKCVERARLLFVPPPPPPPQAVAVTVVAKYACIYIWLSLLGRLRERDAAVKLVLSSLLSMRQHCRSERSRHAF